ncbi:MAG: wax ester/triacylglycerol synthase family O-acyltransferase [Pseudomonadales bacterium]
MKRLDGTSALMIYADIPRCYQHTLKIAVLDYSRHPGGYRFEDMRALIERHSASIPFTRWKVARVPFGINHPFWIRDLEFDISHHVRRIACPAPGDKRAFCQLVSELYAQTLNKDMPLWTTWIVEGLEDSKVAQVTMLHHAYTDGVGASLVLQNITSPSGNVASNDNMGVDPEKNPSRFRILLQGAAELPLIFIREIPALVRDSWKLRELVKQMKRQGRSRPPNPAAAPSSPLLNAPYAHGRCFYYESLDLERFKAVGKHFGVTINDLLLAVITGALRSYHEANSIEIQGPLVASIPFNMRNESQKEQLLGNHVSTSAVTLPIDIEAPLDRLKFVSESAQTMKEYVEATQGIGLIRAAELLPPLATSFINWLIRRSEGQIAPMGNLAVSNVPGPRHRLYYDEDIEISDWLSIGQVSLGVGLNLTAWSYVDRLNICLLANPPVLSDGEAFFKHLLAAFDEYQMIADRDQSARQ